MTRRLRILSAAAVGILLGLGLCGVNSVWPSTANQNIGSWAPALGTVLFAVSALVLLSTLISLAVSSITNYLRKKQ